MGFVPIIKIFFNEKKQKKSTFMLVMLWFIMTFQDIFSLVTKEIVSFQEYCHATLIGGSFSC
jgi:hypothetical protein